MNERYCREFKSLVWSIPIAWEIVHPFDMRLNEEAKAAIQAADADIIVCCDDLMALGAVQVAVEAGLSVPDDVAVIGHDDLPISSVMRPAQTTIRQPLEALGREAVATLLDRISNPERPFRDLALDVQFIKRETTRLVLSVKAATVGVDAG